MAWSSKHDVFDKVGWKFLQRLEPNPALAGHLHVLPQRHRQGCSRGLQDLLQLGQRQGAMSSQIHDTKLSQIMRGLFGQ